MRPTRWDQAPETEAPIASSSRWNGQCSRPNTINWEHHNRVEDAIPNEREHLSTPRPLDYSSESRQRSQTSTTATDNADKEKNTPLRKHTSEPIENQNTIHPPPWSYMPPNMQHLYFGSRPNAPMTYPPHNPWNQLHQGFYANDEFQSDNIFDMKWWGEQREVLESHLRNAGGSNSKEHHEKYEPSRSNMWSFGTRSYNNKHNDRTYDGARKFGRYQGGSGYERNKSYKDVRNFSHNPNFHSSNNNNSRYKYDTYKVDRRPLNAERDTQSHRIWRYNNNNNRDYVDNSRHLEYSQNFSSNVDINNETFDKKANYKVKAVSKSLVQSNKKGKGKKGKTCKGIIKRKKEKKKDSTAEIAKKRALAAAASKLKLSFLAAKKNTDKRLFKKSKDTSKYLKINSSKEGLEAASKSANGQNLRFPKSVPSDGTSLEHDIDIKFSSHEWESVGRGEGGSHNVLDMPTGSESRQKGSHADTASGSKSSKEDSDDMHSESDSVQTIDDIPYNKGFSNNESDLSSEEDEEEEEEEEEEDEMTWNNEETNILPVRRRHASESIRMDSEACNNESRARRVRSYSTSQVEQTSPVSNCAKSTALSTQLKSMLVKQLLSMDKKSLQELVDDPKSRKAQFMMSHFMSMHRNALSQKLNQLRFKSAVTSSAADDEINEFQSLSADQLETLPSDILDQVKEILEFEAKGKAQEMWEEVTLSFSDIFSVLNGASRATRNAPFVDNHKEISSQHIQIHNPVTENGSEDLDCLIVTPPPKLPATTITIPDSDTEIPSDHIPEINDGDVSHSSPHISSQDKDTPPSLSPSSSLSPPVTEGNFLKPQDLTNPMPSSLPHPDRPSNPLPRSPPPLTHLLSPPHHSLKRSPHPTTSTPHSLRVPHPSPFITPPPLVDTKNLRLRIRSKLVEDSEASTPHEACIISIQTPASIKVKQERPSPMMECGLCMHPPRSPHTPQCGFAYGMPPAPVAMIQGAPRSLGAVPQRPVPHLTGSTISSIFKQERQAVTFLNLEHINRPSSEERPKNPAPPDTANSEPPSPLPIPPPPSTLHPPPAPRPLIFSPDDQFTEPPRPPSPPPPQHSPRIKLERQTPQYICCCMRNECERSNSSRQSADFRRGSTPQGVLCDSGTLRATPHSVYKYEPPYLSSIRPRTPHTGNGIVNMFPLLSPSSRCLASNNGAMMQGIVPGQGLNTTGSGVAVAHVPKVNVGVQTEKATRQFVPNISFARSVTPFSLKTDQTTSTEDLGLNQRSLPVDESVTEEWKQFRNVRDTSNCFVSTSSIPEDRVSAVINKFTQSKPSGSVVNQLIQLSNNEKEILSCIESIETKERKLAEERKRLNETLDKINEIRLQKLLQQQSDVSFCEIINTEMNSGTQEDANMNDDNVVSNSRNEEQPEDRTSIHTSNENQFMVSSSQEVSVEFKAAASPSEYFSNDSQSHSLNEERCTSTSLPKENLYLKESSDSEDEENAKSSFCLKTKSHKYCLGKSSFMKRNRLNSGSTTDDYQDDKIKEEKESSHLSSHCNENHSVDCFRETDNITVSSLVVHNGEISHDQSSSLMKVDEENICSLASNRKSSLSCSPQSPKMRNSSGSEHGYSLRSRGPPSELFDFNSDSQLSKDTLISGHDEQLDLSVEKQLVHDKNDDEQADDEFEREEDAENRTLPSKLSPNDTLKKKKRKRKTKYYLGKGKKKKDETFPRKPVSSMPSISNGNLIQDIGSNNNEDQKRDLTYIPLQETFKLPPSHLSAVLDLKVVGNLIFSSSVDGTARLFDPSSGVVLSTYQNHTNSVTAIQVIGEPYFTVGSPTFLVVTGSEDSFIHVYDGKTGVLTQRRNCTEPVRCLDYRWGFLFIGTDGGCGMKWNLKDKKLGEKVQFCGKGIIRMLAHVEGGRKVLVVGAKTTPIMIRDAMSGLFLRTLDYVQLTMYACVFEGNLLYTGGTDKRIFVYDYCGGEVKEEFFAQASVSGLILVQNYLVATCYDGFIRIFRLPKGDLIHTIPVESSHKMFICSALFRNKILIGNKNGEIVCCELPKLEE